MADKKSLAVRKSIAILTVITAMFTVACETDEDPGTTDLGDTDLTETTLDTGTTDDTAITTTTAAGG